MNGDSKIKHLVAEAASADRWFSIREMSERTGISRVTTSAVISALHHAGNLDRRSAPPMKVVRRRMGRKGVVPMGYQYRSNLIPPAPEPMPTPPTKVGAHPPRKQGSDGRNELWHAMGSVD